MTKFSPGDIVKMAEDSVSLVGGEITHLPEGTIGRVCRVTPFGFCCVRLAGKGCRRVHEEKLGAATGSAPACTIKCTSGC